MAFEIVEFEKLIESQYITRSIQGRADDSNSGQKLNYQNTISSKLSNLSLQLYGIMLKTGYVKATKNSSTLTIIFTNISKFDEDKFGFVKNIGFITLIYGKVF
jgi:hypothetical protein